MKKILVSFAFIFTLISLNNTVNAQWAIGASYEIRSEEPENGFGLRLEKGFLNGMPILDLGLRAHFSYFSNEADIDLNEGDVSFGQIDVYDYGLAALAGIKLGLVKPYVGLGIGSQQVKFNADVEGFDFDESSFYWNGFGGAEVTLLPFLNPFIEYRIANLTSADDIHFDNVSRLAIGFNLRF